MINNNPFASWSQSSREPTSGSSTPPSIYGALPYPSNPQPLVAAPIGGATINFAFTNFNPSILNCTFVNRSSQPIYSICTDTSPIFTVVKNPEGRSLALIEWHTRPTVELRGVFGKQEARRWLAMSPDMRSRTMTIGSTCYVWAPAGNFICLYATAPSAPQVLARIGKTPRMITLEMTQTAMDLRLLEPCVVAAVLLQSGRNID
ncbi:hypothetical protein JAAARDRAFT_116910 [Jaapia argillacea MUCL 33604]|uniref:DUF6593 domain-containing protein n=1 Tax=Jaapia argillacea MUCL 33604 TaxID=933084 RepID=A0A067QD27_9AGAM|nr:hypothetical protein JAAARDRAFT_116910 [Jaapia argillacea MUCL 33604]